MDGWLLSEFVPTTNAPTVSVVIATYNRSQILRYAIQSICDSTYTDWELIVVGDACTDDTAECVSSFEDPRIRFINLPLRCGDQSGPNNHGVASARGRYVAFLNHDDLYLPDHLAACLAEIEQSGADFVWVPCALVRPSQDSSPPSSFTLIGLPGPDNRYSPFGMYLASSWLFRRDLAARIGPWQPAEKIFVTPSQDWIFRVWRSGANLRFLPKVTVVVVLAGPRPGSYAQRISPDHGSLARSFAGDPKFMQHVLEVAAVNEAKQRFRQERYPSVRSLYRLMLRPIYWLLARLGIHPLSLLHAIAFGRRGGLIENHRRLTGSE